MAGKGRGWVTAEYGMLPASTGDRKQRDISKGRLDGRIGRDPAADRPLAARRDRLRARSASARSTSTATCCRPTAAPAAPRSPAPTSRSRWRARGCSARACSSARRSTGSVAAVSCGIVDGRALLDLDYSEDSTAEVDANVVMTGDGGLVEVQATAERTPLSRAHLDELLALAASGIERLRDVQQQAIASSAREDCCSRPTTSTSGASSRGCCRATSSSRCRRGRAAARGRRDVRGERARQGARRRGGDGQGQRSPTTRASRPRRSAARPGCARRATPARMPQATRRTSQKLLREAPAGQRAALRLRARLRRPAAGRGAALRGPLRRAAGSRATGRARLRLRPRVPARTTVPAG